MQTLINTLGWVFVLYIIPAIGSFCFIRSYNKKVRERHSIPTLWFLIPFWNMLTLSIIGIVTLDEFIVLKVSTNETWKKIDSYLSGK